MSMRYILIILISLLHLVSYAQMKVNDSESENMIQSVCNAAEEIKSLKCRFIQTKHLSLLQTDMTSEGEMLYNGGNQLKWEYKSPYLYTFILNKDKVLLKSEKNADVIDVRSSRTFQQIARIMLNSITGKCLVDNDDFNVTMLKDRKAWIAELTPKNKGLAKTFDNIKLSIDPEIQMVTSISLHEKRNRCDHLYHIYFSS